MNSIKINIKVKLKLTKGNFKETAKKHLIRTHWVKYLDKTNSQKIWFY